MRLGDELFHRLWTKAVGTDGYAKGDWIALEARLNDRDAEVARLRALLARVPHLHHYETGATPKERAECARLGGACAMEGSER